MSRVLRVAVSKVRMPRSHNTTSVLPPRSPSSADSNHSSMVAEMPRFGGYQELTDRQIPVVVIERT